MKTYTFQTSSKLNADLEEVFRFFSNAENLAKITPSDLKFEIISPVPLKMNEGTIIDYKIYIYKIPVHWRTEIVVWDPPHRFVDIQLKGPYKKWEHEHRFEAEGSKTRITDTVHYQVPGGFLAPLLHQLKIKKDLENIFSHRKRTILQYFKSDNKVG